MQWDRKKVSWRKVVPYSVGSKYPTWDGQHNFGFLDNYSTTELGFVIRAAMFGIETDSYGKIRVKEFRDMSNDEYELYAKCFDELISILHSYAKEGE
jgi:hypothetical protein